MREAILRSELIERIRGGAFPDGGFPSRKGGQYRPDATSWAVLALSAARAVAEEAVERSRTRLAGSQQKDGRVSISPDHPETFWPTPLAVLAWKGSPAHAESTARAVRFLLSTTGRHWVREVDSPLAHDTSLRGWPWTEDTHSWVEPTSFSLLALRAAGHGMHDRAREAVAMLIDRQLPRGGWNYGNCKVYGREILPQPDCTGLALTALAGLVSGEEVGKSLEYLRSSLERLRSPHSLGWGILGLGAWGRRPGNAWRRIGECATLQEKYGPYSTELSSLLLLALASRDGTTGLDVR